MQTQLLTKIGKMQAHQSEADREAKSNVYGFQRDYLASPISNTMMNSHVLKNADVDRMEALY